MTAIPSIGARVVASTRPRGMRAALRAAGFTALFLVAPLLPPRAIAAPPAVAPAGASVQVEISKFAFVPNEVTIAPGTRVVWTNRDDTPHSVRADDNSFSSTGLDTGDTFDYTFAKPGDYAYVCSVHPFMKGVVHVRTP